MEFVSSCFNCEFALISSKRFIKIITHDFDVSKTAIEIRNRIRNLFTDYNCAKSLNRITNDTK